MRNRVAHERVGQDHFGIATLRRVARRQQRGVEAQAQQAAGPDRVLPGEDGVGIELEPTAPHGDDRALGRVPVRITGERRWTAVECRREHGPVTQAGKERMGAEAGEPEAR